MTLLILGRFPTIMSEALAGIPGAIHLAPGASSPSRLEDEESHGRILRERERVEVCKVS